MKAMNVMRVRTFTKRYILPAAPVMLLVSLVGVAQAKTVESTRTISVHAVTHGEDQGQPDQKPSVNVNGHQVTVPADGTTTLNQGGAQTTITHQQGDDNTGTPDVTTTSTSSGSNGVNLSVTSNSMGQNHTYSHVSENSNGSDHSSVHSSTTITTHGTGTVSVTHQ